MTNWGIGQDIADALGWHIITLDPPITFNVDGHEISLHHEIVGINGQRLSGNNELAGRWQTEALCWEHAPYDNWLTDVNVALQLAEYFHVKLTVSFARGTSQWHVRPDIDGEFDYCTLDELAERICVHVLDWIKQHPNHIRSKPHEAWEFKER